MGALPDWATRWTEQDGASLSAEEAAALASFDSLISRRRRKLGRLGCTFERIGLDGPAEDPLLVVVFRVEQQDPQRRYAYEWHLRGDEGDAVSRLVDLIEADLVGTPGLPPWEPSDDGLVRVDLHADRYAEWPAEWWASRLFDPAVLPAPDVMSRRHRAIALLSQRAPNHGLRPFEWDPHRRRASWDNQSGDLFTAYFDEARSEALIWGFDHDSPFSPWPRDMWQWPGMFDGIPDRLAQLLRQDGGDSRKNATFAFWHVDGAWHRGDPEPPVDWWLDEWPDPQGVVNELGPLVFDATVRQYIEAWYGDSGLEDAFRRVLQRAGSDDPLTDDLLEPFARDGHAVTELVRAARDLELRTG